MKKAFLFSATVALCSPVFSARQTWTGKISDAMCGADHSMMQHGSSRMTDEQCTEACVKAGQKYVLVNGGKVYAIENQNFSRLAADAGASVRVTGEASGDGGSIKIDKIEHAGGK